MKLAHRYLTKTDLVAQILRGEILGGSFQSNTQLRQEEVAKRLGVSPTPLREAFGILEKEGFLQRRPHRGVIVVERNLEEIETAYELRIAVESVAVRRLAAAAGPAEIAELQRLVGDSTAALKAHDEAAFRRTTSEFHIAIARAVGSDTIAKVVETLVARSLFYGTTSAAVMYQQQQEHQRILNLIRRRQPDAAVALLTAHMKATVRKLRDMADGPKRRGRAAIGEARSVAKVAG